MMKCLTAFHWSGALATALVLAMPISFKGRIIQYAGRLHRQFEGKQNVKIFDYLDDNLPVARSMFRKRLAGYREMGYKVIYPEERTLEFTS